MGVAKMLLEREDVSPNTADEHGRTPLPWAARKVYEGTVRALLGRRDAAPDTADENCKTPLS